METIKLIRKNNIAYLRFERKDRALNVLDNTCMNALTTHLDTLEQDTPDVLVVESGMTGCFIAGADLDVIAHVTDSKEAAGLAERGQSLFRRIELLPCTSMAIVHGACMGGGLELALACDYLIAVKGDATRLALPEIKIGIHPGFGGCVRLPRKIGWLHAVDMILTGRSVDAARAKRMHLADMICHEAQVEDAIRYMAGKGKAKHDSMQPWWMRLWPARYLFFQQVKKRAYARLKHLDVASAYPALPAAITLLEEVAAMSEGIAYAREAESLGRMAVTPTCAHLIHVFHLGEGLKKQDAVKKGKKYAAMIDHTSVFGAGVMGSGIAWVTAKTGDVDLHDVAADALSRGLNTIKRFAKRDATRATRIRPVLDRSGLNRTQVVIEAVLEDITVKNELWQDVEARTAADTLLLTNTSSLSVSEMQKSTKKAGRMAGMHFFNPAPKMPLVEVVAGAKTTRKTLDTVAALTARWGKYPVIVSDTPGFLVNRCLMPYMSAALRLLEAGQSVETVDRSLKAFGMPMGALELADRVGLDICRHVGTQLSAAFGAHQAMPDWFSKMVDDGLLGEKSGSGFFTYSKGKQGDINASLSRYIQIAESTHDAPVMRDDDIIDACLLPMLIEALQCLDEKVVDTVEHLDAAMIFGIGFPPFRGGLLHYFAAQDVDSLTHRMQALNLSAPKNLNLLQAADD